MWCPWDRTAGVIGPQGSGKTLDLLTPALINAPGAALVTLTKPDDLLLSLPERSKDGRPCVVLDPFGLVPGLPELVWDPIAGCVDRMVSERRAKAFTAGTIHGTSHGSGDAAARFYAAEAAKVLMAYFHAAALTGKTLDDLLAWVAKPLSTSQPEEILRRHPHSDPLWAGSCKARCAVTNARARTRSPPSSRPCRCSSRTTSDAAACRSERRPATNVAEVIRERGTIYLLGREDPYASASPLMTAVAEHVLDTAIQQANASRYGRLCPPMLACLDELPSTAPLPTLRTRMANERALGLSFIYAAQTFRQLAAIFGEQEARALVGLTNVLVWFGGSKDVSFNQEVSDLVGRVRVPRSSWQMGGGRGRTIHSEEIPILRPEELRQLPDKQALVIAENARPIIARLHRCIEGRDGRRLLAQQRALREELAAGRAGGRDVEARTAAALVEAQRHGW